MRKPNVLALLVVLIACLSSFVYGGDVVNKTPLSKKNMLCGTVSLHGNVSDSTCAFEHVDRAISTFFTGVLKNITSRPYFRYFRVNLRRKCPFWNDEGFCMSQGCTVCKCKEDEIPNTWIEVYNNSVKSGDDYGWISSEESSISYGNIDTSSNLRSGDIDDDWIDMAEESDSSSSSQDDIYVNLLENPERFTGYSGPAAIRVWRSVTEENCFGGADDQCLEKRVFYRLMSGLRASISTHVAREYLFSSKTDPYWGPNVPLFVKAVGAYPERLDNLYFTFLFLARAVSRAGDAILSMPLHTGNPEEDRIMREELKLLLNPPEILKREGWGNGGESSVGLWNLDAFLQLFDDGRKCHFPASTEGWKREVEESVDVCMHGFDESRLFQMSSLETQSPYDHKISEKDALLLEFKERFRNISRIMDCVECEKCRLWGKLQFLGMGTAIKALLSSEEQLSRPGFFSRQEVIALINVFHQITKSIAFASSAMKIEIKENISSATNIVGFVGVIVIFLFFVFQLIVRRFQQRSLKKTS